MKLQLAPLSMSARRGQTTPSTEAAKIRRSATSTAAMRQVAVGDAGVDKRHHRVCWWLVVLVVLVGLLLFMDSNEVKEADWCASID